MIGTGITRLVATIEGIGNYSPSKRLQSERDTGESYDAFEKRAWPERMHADADGEVFIPPMALKKCLVDVAGYLGETVPGLGKRTWKKYFMAGAQCTKPIALGVFKDDVKPEAVWCDPQGRPGGTAGVRRLFPIIPAGWRGEVEILLTDKQLSSNPQKVLEYLNHAGSFIGVGRFRPINGGYNGRFRVVAYKVLDGAGNVLDECNVDDEQSSETKRGVAK